MRPGIDVNTTPAHLCRPSEPHLIPATLQDDGGDGGDGDGGGAPHDLVLSQVTFISSSPLSSPRD